MCPINISHCLCQIQIIAPWLAGFIFDHGNTLWSPDMMANIKPSPCETWRWQFLLEMIQHFATLNHLSVSYSVSISNLSTLKLCHFNSSWQNVSDVCKEYVSGVILSELAIFLGINSKMIHNTSSIHGKTISLYFACPVTIHQTI